LVFLRSVFALPILMVFLAWRGELPAAIYTDRIAGHIGRGIAGSCGMFASFFSLQLIPLPDANRSGICCPADSSRACRLVCGWIWLHRRIGDVVAAPWRFAAERFGDRRSLSAALFSAVATIQTRRLTLSEPTGAIVFYFSLTTSGFGLLAGILPIVWQGADVEWIAQQAWRTPPPADAISLIILGSLGGIGQILLTHSYRYADASVVVPFDYTAMIWAILIGLFIFGEVPAGNVVAGAAIVAFAGRLIIWSERQLRLLRKPIRQAGPSRLI
jgi:drug/metabolite transporter (DMT)-like permease